MASVVIKNTFVTVDDDSERRGAHEAARRSRSAPPSRRGAALAGDKAMPGSFAAAQLLRLNDVMAGRAQSPSSMEKAKRPVVLRKLMMSTMELSTIDDSVKSATSDSDSCHGILSDGPCAGSALSEPSKDEEPQTPADVKAVLARLPRNENGHYTSVGSRGHAECDCKPCAFMNSPLGCKFGIFCDFCHFTSGHASATKIRFCKGKRERFRKASSAAAAAASTTSDSPSQQSEILGAWSAFSLEHSEETLAKMCDRALARLDASPSTMRAMDSGY